MKKLLRLSFKIEEIIKKIKKKNKKIRKPQINLKPQFSLK